MFRDLVQVESNVFITARERGKRVPNLCRDGHNIWVNQGRAYLSHVISPAYGLSAPVDNSFIKYIGMGIGGNRQTTPIGTYYPTLAAHYPGQSTYDKADLTIKYLERPVKVSGTAGVGSASGVWGTLVDAPPAFSGVALSTTEFLVVFSEADFHLGGAYPSVPISEAGLILSSQQISHTSDSVYDYVTPPYINDSSRQRIVGYHGFAPITKTSSITLEIRWKIQF